MEFNKSSLNRKIESPLRLFETDTMESIGVIKVTCPLGEYYRATHGKRIIAETLTQEEATKMLDLYTLGYKDGFADASQPSKMLPSLPTTAITATTATTAVTTSVEPPLPPKTVLTVNPFGLSNGVLDLDTLTVRPYSLGDPVILRAGKVKPSLDSIPYVPWEDVLVEIRMELMTFFEQLYPDTQLREYVFALLSSCLFGTKKQSRILVFHGGGSNGKSALQTLLESTFGEYYTTLTPALLARKTVNNDTLEKQVGGRRIVHFSEPDGKIHGAFLKALVDETSAVPFISCNALPQLACADDSVWSRIRVVPHTSVFGSEVNIEHGAAHFPADMELKAKLLRWRIPLLGLLVHNLSMEAVEPECVRIKTTEYRNRYDPYFKFITTAFPREGTLAVKDLRALIRTWKSRSNEEVKEQEIFEQVRTHFANRII